MTQLRIALVHSFYDSSQPSGENDVVEAEHEALTRAGFDVELFGARTDHVQHEPMYRVRAALRVASGRGCNPLQRLDDFGPDVVHVHNLFPNISRDWVQSLRVPLVHTVHNYRPICAAGTLFRSGAVCTLCLDGDRWAGVRNRCYRGSRIATAPIAWANHRGPAADPVLRRARKLLLLSKRQASEYERAGLPMDRVAISPNFLPKTMVMERSVGRHIATPDETTFVFAGRLVPEKGIVRLVDCWPRDIPLTVIGDGPQRRLIEDLTQGTKVQVVGQLSRERTVAAIGAATGFVWPSLSKETFGLTYIEALSMGTPVLAFRDTPVAQTVADDGTGTLTTWSAADIRRAVSQLQRMRGTTSERCCQVFNEHYTEEAYLRRISRLYQEVTSAPGP